MLFKVIAANGHCPQGNQDWLVSYLFTALR